MLIQLPILIAMLDMFRKAIELRGASFVFWWNDLSQMDGTYVLPVLMGLAMLAAQKVTPTPSTQNNMAMKLMPFMFIFLLAQAPSGLVLYWTTSSLFNLGIQFALNLKNKDSEKGKGKKPAKGTKKLNEKAGRK